MEMRVGKKEEEEGEGLEQHVREREEEGGGGTVLECSCGFQDSWQEPCGYGEFDQFVSPIRFRLLARRKDEGVRRVELTNQPTNPLSFLFQLDCCHPSYTPFPQIPIDLMSNQDPSGSSTTFGSPSIKSEADSSGGERVVSPS